MSILVLQSSRWGRESWLLCFFVFMVSHNCCVALPYDAMGLSAVCEALFSVGVLSLLAVTPIVGFCDCTMFCCALLCVHSSFAIISMR